MAGEVKGRVFEILTLIVFEGLGYSQGHNLYWEEKPEGFSIKPDFILGSLRNPSHWFMVTTTISAKNSNMKLWRNLGELFEVKRSYNPPPIIVDLVLESQQDESVRSTMTQISDSQICIQDQMSYGNEIIDFIEHHTDLMPSGDRDRMDYLCNCINDDIKIRQAIEKYKKDLKKIISQKKIGLNPLWDLFRKEALLVKTRRRARNMFLKRGIAKLMLFSSLTRTAIYANVRNGKKIRKLPLYAYQLKMAQKSVGGSKIVDDEIKAVIKYFDNQTLEYILEKTYSSRQNHWNKWLNVFEKDEIINYHNYVLANREELITKVGMLSHLINHTPGGLRWLFWHLIEIFKVNTGRKQGYGFAVLAKDVGYTKGISKGYKYLADWANDALKSTIPENLLPDVAEAFSNRLRTISIAKLKKIGKKIEYESLHNLFEQKFVCYCMFEPIPILLDRCFSKKKIEYNRIQKFPSFLGEMLENTNKITTPVIKVGQNIICWKSAYDKGKHHKTKELAGRAPAIKFQYKTGKFANREGINKLILILDGTFTKEQLDSLFNAGWDEIYYPDEMDELAKAIV
jgi:hypothetical protein